MTEAASGTDLRQRAYEIVSTRGPVCDSEGFYQHIGECFSDATQMAFLFSDGLKETLQPALLAEVVTAEKLREAIIAEIPPKLNGKPGPTLKGHLDKINEYVAFIRHLQNRLARHVLAEYERIDTCPLDASIANFRAPAGKEIYRVGGVNAFGTIGGIKGYTGEEYRANTNAFSQSDLNVFILLMNILFFNNTIQLGKGDISEVNSLIFTMNIPGSRNGHALAFYTCGGQDIMYEDNNGPFLFPWRRFIKKYKNYFPCGKFSIKDKASGEILFKTNYYPIAKVRLGAKYIIMIDGIEEEIEIGFNETQEFDLGNTIVTFKTLPQALTEGYTIAHEYGISVPATAVAPSAVPFRYGARPIRLEENRGGGKRKTRKQKKRVRRVRNSKSSSRSAGLSRNR